MSRARRLNRAESEDNMYKTATEMAQEIRAQLKAQGITSRQVSVKSGICGYSDYIHATIKTAKIDINKVEEIVNQYTYIDRDERTGEILAGGNTYTRTQYSDNAFDDVVCDYIEAAEKLIEGMTGKPEWEGEYIAENFYLFRDCRGFKVNDMTNREWKWTYNAEELAKVLYTWNTHGHI